MWAWADSTVRGPSSERAHESEQNRRSPSRIVWRACAVLPSIPDPHIGSRRRSVVPAPVASSVNSGSSSFVRPAARDPTVVEPRRTDQLDRHLALHALNRADEHVVGVVVGRRARVGDHRLARMPVADRQRVADDEPAGWGHPGRLEDVGARLVAPSSGNVDAVWSHAERTGAAIEQRTEHARPVEAGQAEPFDRAVGRDERAGMAVGEERVVGDRRERVRAVPARRADRQSAAPCSEPRATAEPSVRFDGRRASRGERISGFGGTSSRGGR